MTTRKIYVIISFRKLKQFSFLFFIFYLQNNIFMRNQPKTELFKKAGIFLAGLLTATAVNFAKPVIENRVAEFQQNKQEE